MVNYINERSRFKMKLNELEYKALNLMDEVTTVEIALDEKKQTIHVCDLANAVEPEYDFVTKKYKLSEEFYKMAEVLMQKQFFERKIDQTLEQWVNFVTWNFYSSKRTIKSYKFGKMHICTYEQFHSMSEQHWVEFGYYPKYVKRLK